MKVKLFTHTDLDGIGCGIVGKHAFGDNIDIEYCDYHNVNEKVNEYIQGCYGIDPYEPRNKMLEEIPHDMIIITDISVNEEIARELDVFHYHTTVKIVLLDHHATAKWLNKYEWANVNDLELSIHPNEEYMKSSGTSLLYDYLWNHHNLNDALLLKFVEKVRRYDTWEWNTKFNDLHAKRLNNLLYIIGRERFFERFSNNANITFTDSENLILDIEQQKIEDYIARKQKQLTIKELNSYKVGFVFVEQYHSELGNKLAINNPDLDFIVMGDMGSGKISYRGIKDEIDLGQVAKSYGGGGHPKASGSQMDELVKDEVFTLIFNIGGIR